MKLIWSALFAILSVVLARAQDYRLNDSLYVWEMHGVAMIEDPAHPANVSGKYYYGSAARVVDTDIHRFPASMEVNEGYMMSGHWVRVIIRRDTGYVFDGFLSHLKPFDLRSDARGLELLRANFSGSAEVSKDVRAYSAQAMSEGESHEMSFDNGVQWTIRKVKPCIVEQYTFPEWRYAEVYQFMMAVYSNYFDQSATFMAEPEFVRKTGNRVEFVLKDEQGMRQITLLHKGRSWVINTLSCND